MKTYKTANGSEYQVRSAVGGTGETWEVRRATGGSHYTGRIADGQWHRLASKPVLSPGGCLILIHPAEGYHYTVTSPVTEEIES